MDATEGNAGKIELVISQSYQDALKFSHGCYGTVDDGTVEVLPGIQDFRDGKCVRLWDENVNKGLKPEWLESFLRETFFDSSCTAHPVHKNELNKYCITCTQPICQYCASAPDHRLHEIIKIYRHIYKDVVALDAMRKHIDCLQIQPYKSNKIWVIALEPLPHCGSVKWSEASSCDICKRKLGDPNLYRYCSISCKVQAVLRKPTDSLPPFISLERDRKDETAGASKRVNKRKRTPTRSPLF